MAKYRLQALAYGAAMFGPPAKLTRAQLMELEDAITLEVPRQLAKEIADYVGIYRRCQPELIKRKKEADSLRARTSRLLLALEALQKCYAAVESTDDGLHGLDASGARANTDLQRALPRAVEYWKRVNEFLSDGQAPGRPKDTALLLLGSHVVESLERAGIPITLGRKTPMIEALQLVRRWAGHTRVGGYAYAKRVLEFHGRLRRSTAIVHHQDGSFQ